MMSQVKLTNVSNLVLYSRFFSNRLASVRLLHCSNSLKETSEMSYDHSELSNYKKYYRELQGAINTASSDLASKSPSLITLHNRLSLPEEFSLSTLSRCLTCRSSKLPSDFKSSNMDGELGDGVHISNFNDNYGLNIFGKNILSYHVTHRLLSKYPRLPIPVLNAAVDAYISERVLSSVGKSWGIDIENSSVMERYLKEEPIPLTLGRLRFFNNVLSEEEGIELISNKNFSQHAAYALAVRSIIGALWSCTYLKDSSVAFKFIDQHILSRKLDVTKMFQFDQPTRELATLCRRENLETPISKLLAESGRLSKAPVFIVGVFSGTEKLGEGFGSSLKEAKARAASDALLKWYCYEPVSNQAPIVDPGQVIV